MHLNLLNIFNQCVHLYGKSPFIQLYDTYGESNMIVNGRVFQCHDSISFDALMPILQIMAKNENEKHVLEYRLAHFAVSTPDHTPVRIQINHVDQLYVTNEQGDFSDTISNASNLQITSQNTTSSIYPFHKSLIIISDIDDTIKIANITHKQAAIHKLFIEPFQPYLDMIPIYQQWASFSQFIYLSAGFKQSYGFIKPDLFKYFPLGPIILRSLDISEIFGSSSTYQYKYNKIVEILSVTHQQLVLIGDSTEIDAKIYTDIYLKYPNRICRIMIRIIYQWQVAKVLDSGYLVPPNKFQIFHEAQELYLNKLDC
eukprot:NODE_516_length_6577_cov_0.589379.p4 type:complete len:313 gc:universal NODE_516_length_6577_cov_0.589379:756-1694(+)